MLELWFACTIKSYNRLAFGYAHITMQITAEQWLIGPEDVYQDTIRRLISTSFKCHTQLATFMSLIIDMDVNNGEARSTKQPFIANLLSFSH